MTTRGRFVFFADVAVDIGFVVVVVVLLLFVVAVVVVFVVDTLTNIRITTIASGSPRAVGV